MSSPSFIVLLLASSSSSALSADCACNTYLQPIPVQPYFNQNLGPFLGNPPGVYFFGNGPNAPPTAAPVAAAPAAPPLGPTPECPCMTTPSPNTTPAPGSPDDAKEEIETDIHKLSDEKAKEAKEHADKSGENQVEKVNKVSKEAGELAHAKL